MPGNYNYTVYTITLQFSFHNFTKSPTITDERTTCCATCQMLNESSIKSQITWCRTNINIISMNVQTANSIQAR